MDKPWITMIYLHLNAYYDSSHLDVANEYFEGGIEQSVLQKNFYGFSILSVIQMSNLGSSSRFNAWSNHIFSADQ